MARRLRARDPEPESKVFKKVNSEKEIAFDSDVVHNTGIETVSGSKIFADDAYFGDGSLNNIIITDSAIKKMTDGSVKTYNLPSAAGTLALEGGVIPEHAHSSIASTNGYTIVSAANTGEATLISEHSEIGMSFVFVTQDQANQVNLEMELIVHLSDSGFSQEALENTSTIGIRITDIDNNMDVVPLQEAEMDFQRYGHSDPNYYIAIKENGISVNPNYTFPNYNWVSQMYYAPFTIIKNNGNYLITESWGPIGTQGPVSLSPTALYGRTESAIITKMVADELFAPTVHDHYKLVDNSSSALWFKLDGGGIARFNGNRIWICEHPESGYAIDEDRVIIGRSEVVVMGATGKHTIMTDDFIQHNNTSAVLNFYFPTSGGTFATQTYVDQQIGSIGVVLDAINGEVI